MTYELPQNIDNNKIFIVNRSEINGRLDPLMVLYNRKIKLFRYNTIPLKNVLITQPQYGANEIGIERINDETTRYIRITDIDEFGLLKKDSLGATAANIEDKFILNDGDILFARSGATVGKAYLHNDKVFNHKCIFAGYMIRFIVDKTELLPEYLFTYTQLKPYKEWVKAIQRASGQPNINAEEYKSLLIPLPNIAVQKDIVKKIDIAYAKRGKKISEANDLIKDIDTYLLNELGIILPKKDNSLKNRIFITNLNKVSGGRFDPKLYDNNTTALKNAILELSSNDTKVIQLSDYIVESVAGDWGIEFDDESEDYTRCLVVRATEFDNIYNLNLNNSRVKYRYIKTEKLEKIDIKTDDLLIEKSGGSPDQPVGRISIITQDMVDNYQLCYSNFIHKIRVNSNVLNPQYMFCYLKVMHNIKLTESMQSQTNGIRNLIMKEYLQQPIIVPITEFGDIDIDKQIEIANHIAQIRTDAKRLQQEAKNILEKAKIDVEKMILGE